MSKPKKLRLSKIFMLLMTIVVVSCISTLSAFADSTEDAKRALKSAVMSDMSSEEYKCDGGGVLKGKMLFTEESDQSSPNYGKINESNFGKLTSSEKSRFVSDIAKKSNTVAANPGYKPDGTADNKLSNVSESTVQSWWSELQSQNGIGSQFLGTILENTKPDFVKANAIYKPFSGIVGTVLGVIAVVGMGMLGIVMVLDIFYIALPPMRMLVSDGESVSGGARSSRQGASKLISNDAIYAVRVAEDEGDGDGSKKQALGVYLKRRVPMLILLGICLLYLVSGSIYTLVGYILDLVSGFLGF